MKTVRDDDGNQYILLKRSGDASLVRDPKTGNDCYVGNDRLEPVEGTSVLETAANAIPEPVRRLLTGVHDERSLGLLVELADRGPLSVRHLIAETDYCESDLHGTLASLTARGLIEETTVVDDRGYALSSDCEPVLATLRALSAEGNAADGTETEDNETAEFDPESVPSTAEQGRDAVSNDDVRETMPSDPVSEE